MIWQVVQEYGLLDLTSNELRGNEQKRLILAGVMSSLGQPITDMGCLKCFYEAQETLKRLHRNEMAKQQKGNSTKYTMQPGENYFLVGFGWVNRDNLTDEIAEKILESNPAANKVIKLNE